MRQVKGHGVGFRAQQSVDRKYTVEAIMQQQFIGKRTTVTAIIQQHHALVGRVQIGMLVQGRMLVFTIPVVLKN